MASFEKAFNELKTKVEKGSSTFSRGELVALTDAAVNDPDFTYEAYSKRGDEYETEKRTPSRDLRNAVKKLTKKEFGISDTELTKLDTAQFPKDFSSAISEINGVVTKKYMEAGKTYKFPMTSASEATMKISIKEAKEEVRATNKIVKDEKTGEYRSEPTGKTVKTLKHTAIVGKNGVPGWLKKEV